MLDLYDKKILYHLDQDARTPAARIAKHVKLSKEAVNKRIRNLTDTGVINQFYTYIDASKLGFRAFRLSLTFNQSTTEKEQSFLAYLHREPSCVYVTLSEGPHFDVAALTLHRDFRSLQRLIDNILREYGDIIAGKEVHAVLWHERHNQRYFIDGEKKSIRISYEHIAGTEISKKRAAVLNTYANDARKSIAKAAETLDMEPQSVRYHLKRLEQEGIIKEYCTEIDLHRIGRRYVIIDVTVKNPDSLKSMQYFFEERPESVFTSRLLGKYDLSIDLVVEDYRHLRRIMDEFKTTFEDDQISYDLNDCYESLLIGWSPLKHRGFK